MSQAIPRVLCHRLYLESYVTGYTTGTGAARVRGAALRARGAVRRRRWRARRRRRRHRAARRAVLGRRHAASPLGQR